MSRTMHPRRPRSLRPLWVLVLTAGNRLVPAKAIPHEAARFYTEERAAEVAARLNAVIDEKLPAGGAA